jgi:tetratricopeptide (TPR) repeat protein
VLYNGHLSIEELEELSQQRGPAENQAHMQVCPQCKSLLADCQELSAKLSQLASVRIGGNDGMNCPDERVWLDVAGGTLSPEETTKYVQHAADCPSCGPKLQAATQLFQDELTPEEEKAISSLPSASPTAQRRLAERLTQSTPSPLPEPVHKGKRSIWWPLSFSLAGAAAVAAVVFFLVPVLLSRNSPAEAQKLLAEAYTQDRKIEMRIPGAKHAEMKQQRSGDAGSLLAMPEAERKALDKIAAGQKKDPDNPQWLILQAQADLLDRRYKPALSALSRVETGTDSTDFLLTRALALNEQGEAEHDPQLQGHAIDLLGRILQKEPDNTTALFNQAIVCEELYMYECASKDWQHVLQIEKDPGWIAEAREHLNRIVEKKTLDK